MNSSHRVIYFPVKHEIGCTEKEPIILVVTKIIGWNAAFNAITLSEYEKNPQPSGWGAMYSAKRCITYTDEAWQVCQDYLERKAALEAEYKKLQSTAKKATSHEQQSLL